MKKRLIGYAAWILMSGCLYFFENNSGTRIILLCSVLVPLIPFLRAAFFTKDGALLEEAPGQQTIGTFVPGEAEDPGDVRLYQPGDPVRRIHWKLSAKRDELLVRETAEEREPSETEQPFPSDERARKKKLRKRLAWALAGLTALCAALLLLIPEARQGVQALCNRLYAASEAVNAYAYDYFPVPDGQNVTFASVLAAGLLLAPAALSVLLRSRAMALCIMAAVTLFQVYFGLPFPSWINIPLYGLSALWMAGRPVGRGHVLAFTGTVLLAALFVALLCPGVDADTEAASENVRDQLSRMASQITGTGSELQEGETETRHVHTRSLQAGENEARTDREYRLVTVEEEQISMPRFINWMKAVLLFLLVIALVVLPFVPFLLLNARKKKAEEERKAFASGNVSEAVCAIFRQVIAWLRESGHDAGNLLYRDWAEKLPDAVPEGYADRFTACAKDYEEAAYSTHELSEEQRERALSLLKETESALWQAASRKQRFRIRYWMCLRE